jgi:hypothetical protein
MQRSQLRQQLAKTPGLQALGAALIALPILGRVVLETLMHGKMPEGVGFLAYLAIPLSLIVIVVGLILLSAGSPRK